MTKTEKAKRAVEEAFNAALCRAMNDRFNIDVETGMTLDMRKVTTRVDGADFTEEQIKFLEGFSIGYGYALNTLSVLVYNEMFSK